MSDLRDMRFDKLNKLDMLKSSGKSTEKLERDIASEMEILKDMERENNLKKIRSAYIWQR